MRNFCWCESCVISNNLNHPHLKEFSKLSIDRDNFGAGLCCDIMQKNQLLLLPIKLFIIATWQSTTLLGNCLVNWWKNVEGRIMIWVCFTAMIKRKVDTQVYLNILHDDGRMGALRSCLMPQNNVPIALLERPSLVPDHSSVKMQLNDTLQMCLRQVCKEEFLLNALICLTWRYWKLNSCCYRWFKQLSHPRVLLLFSPALPVFNRHKRIVIICLVIAYYFYLYKDHITFYRKLMQKTNTCPFHCIKIQSW